MKTLFLLALLVVVVGAGMKVAGIPVPFIDYPVGPLGIEGLDPRLPRIEIEAPGYGEFPAP
jgi:hypothetical protein